MLTFKLEADKNTLYYQLCRILNRRSQPVQSDKKKIIIMIKKKK